MFDIPELDAMVIPKLDRHSLVQCSQVNKRWYRAVMPQIWKELPELRLSKWAPLRQVVLEDYCYQQQQQQTPERLEEAFPGVLDFDVPVLTRYGAYMVDFPDALDLVEYFRPTIKDSETDVPLEPSEYDLFRHLSERCPERQFPKVHLFNRHFSQPALVDLLADCILPWCTEWAIGEFYGEIIAERTVVSTTTLKRLFSKASAKLEALEINLYDVIPDDKDLDLQWNPTASSDGSYKGMTYLRLMRCGGVGDGAWNFWHWFFQGCGDVSFLCLENISKDMLGNLAQAIGLRMPKLERIVVGDYSHLDGDEEEVQLDQGVVRYLDHDLALLFLASKGIGEGLKEIDCGSTTILGPMAFQMLDMHKNALLDFESRGPASHEGLVRILSTYPRLCRFATINDLFYPSDFTYMDTPASLFVDWDEFIQSYRPWQCESTLHTLYIGIEMPEPMEDHYMEMHRKVYGRLARLTHLEELWLGHSPYTEYDEIEVSYQEDCLQLTLESGLEILGGLKNLKGLNVAHMEHSMGVAEVQWMVKTWPKLKSICGLKEESDAYLWLKNNHPNLTKPIWYPLRYYRDDDKEEKDEDMKAEEEEEEVVKMEE
ncbi:hypothetical protein BGZ59_002847 [Podila verticillata]|nr:hypothetical protein BGZ59_002847 [Podila verticillata]